MLSRFITAETPEAAAGEAHFDLRDAVSFVWRQWKFILAIVAVVKGSGAKRLMNQFPVEPSLRSKATAGQVMGWITLGIAVILIITFAILLGTRR